MNYSKIEAFLKIVEYGNITKAANSLYISQSTLSDRLTSLENELNTILIMRSPGIKNIQLTNKGMEFLDYANRFLVLSKDIEIWKNSVYRSQINISAPLSLNNYFFNSFYSEYINSNIFKLNISSHWNHTIYTLLDSYEIDIAIVSRPFNLKNISTVKLFKEPMTLIYNSNFSDYSNLKFLKHLKQSDEINLDWGPDYELWLQKHITIDSSPKISVDSPELLIQFLKTNMSWGMVPLCIYNNIHSKYPFIKSIKNIDSPYRTIYLATQRLIHSNKSTQINSIIESIEDYILKMESNNLCIKL